ncbi:MAG: hypothetical protein J1F42_06755 [Lachnospiraceae bacterium]|nr:hypothetical protein [Lachnospiraceae bacterium]
MLHIILLILKIIGIVLLSIVGIILLAFVCVLFVPVRYRIRLTREEGENAPPVTAYVKVTWLLHIVNALIRYPAKVTVRVRIMIFTLFRIPDKEKKAHKEKKSNKSSTKEKPKRREDQDRQEEVPAEVDVSEDKQEYTVSETPESTAASAVHESYEAFGGGDEDSAEREEDSEDEENPTFFGKIRHILKKIKAFFQNIRYTIRKFCDKIKSVLDNIQYYREVLESEPFLNSMELCKKELSWMFKKLKPDKFEADFIVGMEDPASTGEILAVCGILYPLIGPHVRVVGDFECEKMRLEGRLYIRGKIRVFTFLRIALRIYFNKNIKQLIKILKKEAV